MESKKIELVPKKWKSVLSIMKVVAEVFTGSLFYVEVGENATVGDLKKEIEKQENLPGNRLMLLLNSEKRYLLDRDETSLKCYGVKDSSHIYIIFKPPDTVASSASPSTTKEYASMDSMDSTSAPLSSANKNEANNDEASHQETASDGANEPSASVDQEE